MSKSGEASLKVLVTGASGFLGSHVAEQLSRAGHTTVALVRKTSDTKFLRTLPRVDLAEGSVEDRAGIDRALDGVDAVVHAAGLVKARTPADFTRTNVDGTRNVLEAAKARAGAIRRFVFVSSLAAVGPSRDGKPVPRDQSPEPVTEYGRSKLAAERLVLLAKDLLNVTVIRPPAIYGPRDREILAFFKSVKMGVLPTVGTSETTLSIVYGEDAAAACVKAISANVPSGSTYFVDDGAPYPFRKMVEGIEEALGKRAWLRLPLPLPVVYAAALGSELFGKATGRAVMLTRDKLNELRAPHWVCSSEETRRELGWAPRVSFAEGTRITAAWYREHGWL